MKVIDIFGNKTTMQTFDDSKLERPLQRVFEYDNNECMELNDKGAGIFWTINPQENPDHRGVATTYEFACLGMDCDVAKETDEKRNITRPPEEEVQSAKVELFNKLVALPVPPSGIIETRNGLQPYWVFTTPQPIKKTLRDIANIRYQDFIRGITQVTGIKSEGDNIQRVLRMPGYYHKKSQDVFLIQDIFEEGVRCDFEAFKEAYPPITKEGKYRTGKTYTPTDAPTKIEDIPVQEALEKLSGMGVVNGEVYDFRPNSNGTIQIIIDGKASSQFINPENNTIGSANGQGNPTVIQWLAWYYKNKGETNEIAHAKAYQILFPLLLPHIPEEQWGNAKLTKKIAKATGRIIIPTIDPNHTAQMLTNPDFSKGIMTEYHSIDIVLKGLKKQFLYGVVAASGQGKSILAVNILYNVAQQGYPVAYFDLENGPIMGEKRLLQIHTGWTSEQMESLETTDKDLVITALQDLESKIKFYRLYDLEASQAERQHVKAMEIIRHLVKEKEVRVVCIDNMNCFTSDKRTENEYFKEIFVAFSQLAVELDISIIVIHHATDKLQKDMGYSEEDVEQNKPKKFLLPYLSKALGTSAFVEKINVGITFTHKIEASQLVGSIEKNRDGESGKFFHIYFQDDNLRITNTYYTNIHDEIAFNKEGFVKTRKRPPEPKPKAEQKELIKSVQTVASDAPVKRGRKKKKEEPPEELDGPFTKENQFDSLV